MAMSATAEKPPKRFDSPQQEVFLNLWRTYDRLRALEDEFFARYGLTPQQYNALRLLGAAYPQKVPTLVLANRLISRAPDITRLLDKLHDRGLVERERPADNRRTVMVGITESGLNLVDEMAPEVRECHVRQVGHLEADEMRTLIDLLNKVRIPHESPDSNWR
jgi:DNA-binding MarR family transcriptional regulator